MIKTSKTNYNQWFKTGFILYWSLVLFLFGADHLYPENTWRENAPTQILVPEVFRMYASIPKIKLEKTYIFYHNGNAVDTIIGDHFFADNLRDNFPNPLRMRHDLRMYLNYFFYNTTGLVNAYNRYKHDFDHGFLEKNTQFPIENRQTLITLSNFAGFADWAYHHGYVQAEADSFSMHIDRIYNVIEPRHMWLRKRGDTTLFSNSRQLNLYVE